MFEDELNHIKKQNRFRRLQALETAQSPQVQMNGKTYLLFCSNNYLGLAVDPRLSAAVKKATEFWGWGAGASRLLSGNSTLHQKLEEELARFVGFDSALLFNSGYQANCGAIPALMEKGDIIFSDSLNHASLIDGCRLSRARVVIYPHRDADKLEKLIKTQMGSYRRKMIVTESVFSMEGTLAPLSLLKDLALRYDSLLYVDDAHGLGVLGRQGQGSSHHFAFPGEDSDFKDRCILLGTLGKALGSFGAFVAGSRELKEVLVNKARTFIFSTGLPPALCAASLQSLEILQSDLSLLENLRRNCRIFSQGLKDLGFPVGEENSFIPIQPVILGTEKRALKVAEQLMEQGIFVRAIRPPTVASNQCRIRFSLMASHSIEDLDQALEALKRSI
jgi:glycine C-acetyltransferase/8-amino-7-oxononanoate synthase